MYGSPHVLSSISRGVSVVRSCRGMMDPSPARTAVMHSGVCSSRILKLRIAAAYMSLFSHLQGRRSRTKQESVSGSSCCTPDRYMWNGSMGRFRFRITEREHYAICILVLPNLILLSLSSHGSAGRFRFRITKSGHYAIYILVLPDLIPLSAAPSSPACPFLSSLPLRVFTAGTQRPPSTTPQLPTPSGSDQRFRAPTSQREASPGRSSLQLVTEASLESLVPGKLF